jgi:4'-phosphopantetheinyl transferase
MAGDADGINYILWVGESLFLEHVRTEMDKEPLYLWYAYPEDLLNESAAEACAELLSDDERARWHKYKFEPHRREYLTTRALVRTALSQYHPLAPKAWYFKSNVHGRPAADPACGLLFNLSNSPGLVVCLISRGGEVGVDAEPYDRAEKVVEVAAEVFSPLELAQLQTLRSSERLDRAMSLWTLKEAYIKARGMGLALPLKKFSFLFGGADAPRLELDPELDDEAGRWRFCLLEHAGHRIALMAEQVTEPELELWEMRPSQAAPTQLPAGEIRWFPASQTTGH